MKRSEEKVSEDIGRLISMLTEPRTLAELAQAFECGERTIYRWLRTVEAQGFEVARVGTDAPHRFVILG